jgi:hypothetical protein
MAPNQRPNSVPTAVRIAKASTSGDLRRQLASLREEVDIKLATCRIAMMRCPRSTMNLWHPGTIISIQQQGLPRTMSNQPELSRPPIWIMQTVLKVRTSSGKSTGSRSRDRCKYSLGNG